jgi:hypothetical protein
VPTTNDSGLVIFRWSIITYVLWIFL